MAVKSDAARIVGWEPGTRLEPRERSVLDRVDIAKFAAAIGDFNPIHVDEEFARAVGFPSVIAHGPLTLSLIAQVLGINFGASNVRSVNAQFRTPAFPGDLLRAEGVVTAIIEEAGERRAECEIQVLRSDGEIVAAGGGKAAVPDDE
jgi:acyl dehydratase